MGLESTTSRGQNEDIRNSLGASRQERTLSLQISDKGEEISHTCTTFIIKHDLMLAFEQELGIENKNYILTEVCSFDIIKNYHGAQKTATLSTLKIR